MITRCSHELYAQCDRCALVVRFDRFGCFDRRVFKFPAKCAEESAIADASRDPLVSDTTVLDTTWRNAMRDQHWW